MAVYQCSKCKAKVSVDAPPDVLASHVKASIEHHAKVVGCDGKMVQVAEAPAPKADAKKEDADEVEPESVKARQRRG